MNREGVIGKENRAEVREIGIVLQRICSREEVPSAVGTLLIAPHREISSFSAEELLAEMAEAGVTGAEANTFYGIVAPAEHVIERHLGVVEGPGRRTTAPPRVPAPMFALPGSRDSS